MATPFDAQRRDAATHPWSPDSLAHAVEQHTWTPPRPKPRHPRLPALLAILVATIGLWVVATPHAWSIVGLPLDGDDAVASATLPTGAVVAAHDGVEPVGPAVSHATYGSTSLVRYLERSMIAQVEQIDVTYWWTSGSRAAHINDAMFEAITQSPYLFVDSWRVQTLTSEVGQTVTIEPAYSYDTGEAQRRQAVVAAAVDQWLAAAGVHGAMSDTEKAIAIHDVVAANATYDHDAAALIETGGSSPAVTQSQEAYGIFGAGSAVCNGYAQAYLVLAEAAGLDSVIVTGTAWNEVATGRHAWNLVSIGGEWKLVDTTWDDSGDLSPTPDAYLLVDLDDPALNTRQADADWMVDGNIAEYL